MLSTAVATKVPNWVRPTSVARSVFRPIADTATPIHSVLVTLPTHLAETLAMIGQATVGTADPWWIIGSAAVVLHGGAVRHVKDVDLMMSASDADALLRRIGGDFRKATASERFRSLVFGVWSAPPVPVEVFGGFSLYLDETWRELSLSTRERVTVAGSCVYVPSAEELVRVLHLFGRPKDLERAKLLRS